jgi:hypothetical protein
MARAGDAAGEPGSARARQASFEAFEQAKQAWLSAARAHQDAAGAHSHQAQVLRATGEDEDAASTWEILPRPDRAGAPATGGPGVQPYRRSG